MRGAVAKAADHLHGTEKQFIQGTGEFIGPSRSTGTEREQRGDARRVCEKIIRDVDVARKTAWT
jgi:hypothetical protein